jgi:hypothetical protein
LQQTKINITAREKQIKYEKFRGFVSRKDVGRCTDEYLHPVWANVGRFHTFLQATKTLRERTGIALLCF